VTPPVSSTPGPSISPTPAVSSTPAASVSPTPAVSSTPSVSTSPAPTLYTLGVHAKSFGAISGYYVWYSTDGFVTDQTKIGNAITTSDQTMGSGIGNIANGTTLSFAVGTSSGPVVDASGTPFTMRAGSYTGSTTTACSGNNPAGYINYIVNASATVYIYCSGASAGAC
jgi:hypothetical protein